MNISSRLDTAKDKHILCLSRLHGIDKTNFH